MRHLIAERVSSGGRRGSSRPLVVETGAGAKVVKLRGAAQGTAPLVAEVIVGALADALALPVPPRALVELPRGVPVADWDDELDQLLAASVGVNLGFDYLAGARELTSADAASVDAGMRARILWLDLLVLNPDRTTRNPNLLSWSNHLWLIDHGAALGFQYDWRRVTETTPREPALQPDAHLFESLVGADELRAADADLAPRLTREVVEGAVAAVPNTFLEPLLSGTTATLERRRAAYAAFLWKRLAEPRPFLEGRALPPERRRAKRPAWLGRR